MRWRMLSQTRPQRGALMSPLRGSYGARSGLTPLAASVLPVPTKGVHRGMELVGR